jgi:hypothetical protein
MVISNYLRSLIIPITLLLLSFASAIAVAEVGLRLTHSSEAGRTDLTRFYEYDSLLGWRHKRNFTGELKTSEYHLNLQYNARGWRGLERPYNKPQNVSRIIVLGDSFVDGYSVQVQDRLTEVLETNLGSQFEVVNLGVAGYSTDQELLLLEEEGWKYQPDLVVLAFYYNDVWGNGSSYLANSYRIKKPLFVMGVDGILSLTNVPVPNPSPTLRDRSRVYGLVRTAIKGNPVLYSLAIKAGIAEHPSAAPTWAAWGPLEFEAYRKSETPELIRDWTITQALLRKMKWEAEQKGSHFVVLDVPARIELSPQEWSAAQIPPDYDPHQVAGGLGGICKAEGIPYIDPTDRFRNGAKQGPLYFVHDPHWNAAGHHLAAKILAEHVQSLR